MTGTLHDVRPHEGQEVTLPEVVVDRVFRYAPESGWVAMSGITTLGRRPIHFVGHLPVATVRNGDCFAVQGVWRYTQSYGWQVHIKQAAPSLPSSLIGIREFLSSFCPGISGALAAGIVQFCSENNVDLWSVLENEPHRLYSIRGLGDERIGAIRHAWKAHKNVRDTVVALGNWGVHSALALKVIRHLGDDAFQKVDQDPYLLSAFVGFPAVDQIARTKGYPLESPDRIIMGIRWLLRRFWHSKGHTIASLEDLLAKDKEQSLLGVSADAFVSALNEGLTTGQLAAIQAGRSEEDVAIDAECDIMDAADFWSENTVADVVTKLTHHPPEISEAEASSIATRSATELGVVASDEQLAAVAGALRHHFVVITGGPGVGKTVTTKVLVNALMSAPLNCHVVLASPTGKAALRLSQATGEPAHTIHRLSGYRYRWQEFADNGGTLTFTAADALIVDEAAMVDSLLMAELLSRLTSCWGDMPRVILIGDVDQLPPIARGHPFRDLVDRVPTYRLTQFFRTAKDSTGIENAHRINRGEMPILPTWGNHGTADNSIIHVSSDEEAFQALVRLLRHDLPREGFDPIWDVQILVPIRKTSMGVAALNAALQSELNPTVESLGEVSHGDRCFRIGDKVIHMRNNYNLNVMNGQVGRVAQVNQQQNHLTVEYGNETGSVAYDAETMQELDLAYAITVHRYQGSECPCVVLPVLNHYGMMLYRSLLYTGWTRFRKRLIVIGTEDAIKRAVETASPCRRTALGQLLDSPFDPSKANRIINHALSGRTAERVQLSWFDF